jgi:riboflavin synthase
MDLNVYEDDDDDTLHRKLIAAKIARKRAEEDMKLLSNRISLLKQEENKVI